MRRVPNPSLRRRAAYVLVMTLIGVAIVVVVQWLILLVVRLT